MKVISLSVVGAVIAFVWASGQRSEEACPAAVEAWYRACQRAERPPQWVLGHVDAVALSESAPRFAPAQIHWGVREVCAMGGAFVPPSERGKPPAPFELTQRRSSHGTRICIREGTSESGFVCTGGRVVRSSLMEDFAGGCMDGGWP